MNAPAHDVTVRYFAALREALGRDHEVLHTHATTLGALRDELQARGGAYASALSRQRAGRGAVNQVMADETTPLPAGAEVAFFPPVTGG